MLASLTPQRRRNPASATAPGAWVLGTRGSFAAAAANFSACLHTPGRSWRRPQRGRHSAHPCCSFLAEQGHFERQTQFKNPGRWWWGFKNKKDLSRTHTGKRTEVSLSHVPWFRFCCRYFLWGGTMVLNAFCDYTYCELRSAQWRGTRDAENQVREVAINATWKHAPPFFFLASQCCCIASHPRKLFSSFFFPPALLLSWIFLAFRRTSS